MTASPVDQTILSATSFVGSIGVNTHVAYAWGSYNNLALMTDDLKYLGVTTLRDGLATSPSAQPVLDSLAAAGFKFDLVVPSTLPATGAAGLQQYITSLNQFEASHPGSIVALEGLNEANAQAFSYNGSSSIAAAAQFQQAFYAAVKADGALAGVPVYDLTMAYNNSADYAQLGNLSGSTDYANAHAYASTQLTPQAALMQALGVVGSAAAGKPLVITETGYTTQANTQYIGADESVQAKSILNTLADAYKDGVSQTYLYELLDHATSGGASDPEAHFGLFNSDGSPKLAATAIHNLTTILADNGTGGHTPTTALGYSLNGLPATGNSMVLGKSNGAYDLVVWAEPKIWNDTTDTEIAAPTTQVTVNLGGVHHSVNVYDPMGGTTPIATYTDVSQIVIPLSDHPLIIEIDAPLNSSQVAGAAPVSIVGTAADIVAQLSTLSADSALQTITLTDTHTLAVASQSTMNYMISHYGNALAAIQGGYTFSVTTSAPTWTKTLIYDAHGTLLSTSNSGVNNGVVVSTAIVYANGSTDTTSYTAGVKANEIHVNADGSKEVYAFHVTGQPYTTLHNSYDATGFLTNVSQMRADGSLALNVAQTKSGTKTTDTYDTHGVLTTEVVQMANGYYSTTVYTAGVKTAAYILNADHTQDNWTYNIKGQSYTSQLQHLDTAGKATALTRYHADGSLAFTQVLGSDGTNTVNNYSAAGVETSSTVTHSDGSKDVYLLNVTGKPYTSEHDTYSTAGLLTSQVQTHGDGSLAFKFTQTSNGTRTTDNYDAHGVITSEAVQMANGYYSTTVYAAGVKTAAYIQNADHSQDNWTYNITGQSYTSQLQHIDTTGKATALTRYHADGSLAYTQLLAADGTNTVNNYNAAGVEIDSTVTHTNGTKDVYLLNITGKTYTSEHDTYSATGLMTNQVQTHSDGSLAFKLAQTSTGTKTSDSYDTHGILTSEAVQMANGYYSTTVYTGGIKTAAYIQNADHTQDNWSYNVTGQTYTTQDQHLDTTGKVVAVTRTHADGSLAFTQVIGTDGTSTVNNYNATGVETSSTVTRIDGSKDVYLLNITGQSYTSEHDTYSSTGLLTNEIQTHSDGSLAFHLTQTSAGTKTSDIYDTHGVLTSEMIQMSNGYNSTTVYTAGVKTAAYILNADGTRDNWTYNVSGQTYTSQDQHLDATGKAISLARYHTDGTLDYSQVINSDGSKVTDTYNSTGVKVQEVLNNAVGTTDVYKYVVAGSPGAVEHDSYAANGSLLKVDVLNSNGTHTMTATSTGLLLEGGNGNDLFSTAPGSTTVLFDHGNDQITNFHAGTAANHDTIEIAKSLVSDYSHLQVTQTGNDVLVHISTNDSIVLKNVLASHLSSSNFAFV